MNSHDSKSDEGLPPWTTFETAFYPEPTEEDVRQYMALYGVSREHALKSLEVRCQSEVFLNSRYQVVREEIPATECTRGDQAKLARPIFITCGCLPQNGFSFPLAFEAVARFLGKLSQAPNSGRSIQMISRF